MLNLLGLFSLAGAAFIAAEDWSMRPSFDALNFNVTLNWNQPEVTLAENETILYTVLHYRTDRVHSSILSCVNIKRTSCCLVERWLPSGNLQEDERFGVTYSSSLRPNVTGESVRLKFRKDLLTVSAPTIRNLTITSRNITVDVQGPDTPFFDMNGRRRLMGEMGLGGELVGRVPIRIYYSSKFVNMEDQSEQAKGWTLSKYGELRIVYNSLAPYTQYSISIWSRYMGESSSDVATMEFRTDQEAPELPPIVETTILSSHCDTRDLGIAWKEPQNQRENVDIKSYVVELDGRESNGTESVVLSGETFSTVLENLNRWEMYDVRVTSINAKGNRTGLAALISEDGYDKASYEPSGMTIARIALRQWELTWNPPTRHQQCIAGYVVRTSRDGARTGEQEGEEEKEWQEEEETIIRGHDVSSATLHFEEGGRYLVELSPIVEDVMQTKVTTTMEYYVKDRRVRQWLILVAVIVLIVIMLTAVIVVSRKVCCGPDNLPDISKSGAMRIASRKGDCIASLRAPPEKETFDETTCATVHKMMAILENDSIINDEVFEPKRRYSDRPSPISDYIYLDRSVEHIDPTGRSGVVNEIGTAGNVHSLTFLDGVDGHTSKTPSSKSGPSEPVYIPHSSMPRTKPGTFSTQSSDSGVGSPVGYDSSIFDYVASTASISESTHQRDSVCGYESGMESPYVTAALADRSDNLSFECHPPSGQETSGTN